MVNALFCGLKCECECEYDFQLDFSLSVLLFFFSSATIENHSSAKYRMQNVKIIVANLKSLTTMILQ